jgi:hypothetical protein
MSPAAATFIQGFSLVLDAGGCFSKTTDLTLVTGKIYAADYNTQGCPTPNNLTVATTNKGTAYTDAAGRTPGLGLTDLGTGSIGGLRLAPGVYKWNTAVSINSDVTLDGGPNDVYIFQMTGDLTQATVTSVLTPNGALSKNIFWQVGGLAGVVIGASANMKGVILADKAIVLNTNASVVGRLLGKTQVTLDGNKVTKPTQ